MEQLKKYYTEFYAKSSLRDKFPNEYVVRIFRGVYPKLKLSLSDFGGKKIADIGCGDGRNLLALANLGLELYGTEITDEISQSVQNQLAEAGVKASVKTGVNRNLPLADEYFDYLLSWNSCYYMGEKENYNDFNDYLKEFSRVLKPNGILVLSIPMVSNFIFSGSKEIKKGYRLITDDPYKVRNNHVMKCFENESDIISLFSDYFENFIFGSIIDDCFGQNNHWHLVVCTRK